MALRALLFFRRFKIPNFTDSKCFISKNYIMLNRKLLPNTNLLYCIAISGLATYSFVKWHQMNTVYALNLKKKVSKHINA